MYYAEKSKWLANDAEKNRQKEKCLKVLTET